MENIKLVTGTGSSGTTFFIEFLAKLGLTNLAGSYNNNAKGGYEWVLNGDHDISQIPKIFKDPRAFFGDLEFITEELRKVNKSIDFIWVCYRNFVNASESRIKRNVIFHSHKGLYGIGYDDHAKQVDFFRKGLEQTILFLCQKDIRFMFVDYDRLNDVAYCAQCLQFAGYTLPIEDIEIAHKNTYVEEYKNRYKILTSNT